ncbi:MAG: hypothetical protein HY735_37130 [Verrucomicrobia bacterium]|nr:hypothetical protein [Verrucomicrobiota bacterium]
MVIKPNAWSVGSLASADSNAHSFHSPNWKHSGSRQSATQEVVAVEDDVVTIASHAPYNLQATAVNIGLINAISFSQTQDGFLKKVQEALQRMGELSVMAQSEEQTDAERLNHTVEFAQLQDRIKEIEKKMFRAANLFQPEKAERIPSASTEPEDLTPESCLRPLELNAWLHTTSNPDVTTISSTQNALAAVDRIHGALEAVADLRAKVRVDLQRLNSTGERLAALEEAPCPANLQIRDVGVAEENTRFARYDILAKSGTVMLAQANALPQSALRLLN